MVRHACLNAFVYGLDLNPWFTDFGMFLLYQATPQEDGDDVCN